MQTFILVHKSIGIHNGLLHVGCMEIHEVQHATCQLIGSDEQIYLPILHRKI